MKSHHLVAGLIAAFGVTSASLATDASVEAISAEARLAAQHVAVNTCANCHGHQGRSIAPKFPVLAGQHAGYLAAQLHAFKAQTRGDPDALGYMWGMAAPLDDEMIEGLAAYYAAQAPGRGVISDPAVISRGADIYAKGIPGDGIPPCAGCHGSNGAGTDQFPRLAGQHAQYLLKQLRSFQSNLRDVAIMHGVAKGMAIGEMEAVAAYLESL